MTLLGDPRETLQYYFFKTWIKIPSVLLIPHNGFLSWVRVSPYMGCWHGGPHGGGHSPTCIACHWPEHQVSRGADAHLAVCWLQTNFNSVKMFSWECWLYLHYLTHDTCLAGTGDRSPHQTPGARCSDPELVESLFRFHSNTNIHKCSKKCPLT